MALVMARLAAPHPTLMEQAQAAGFMIGGEPLAVDLADTLVMVSDPNTDLLSDKEACQRFWRLQGRRLPDGWTIPSLADTREIRDAIRRLLDLRLSGRRLDSKALHVVNRVSGSVAFTLEGVSRSGSLHRLERYRANRAQDLALGTAARSAIELLADESDIARLRRCANPNCSMLFVNGDARRQWCTPNICGNRARVARHYHRHRRT